MFRPYCHAATGRNGAFDLLLPRLSGNRQMTPELVWFKRDLRITDHSPLVAAAKRGQVICLYIYEPDLIGADDFSKRHLLFINDSLTIVAICAGSAVDC